MPVQRGRLARREADPSSGVGRPRAAAVPGRAGRAGVEEVVHGVYRRSLAGGSVLELRPGEAGVVVHGSVAAARAILRLDADPRRSRPTSATTRSSAPSSAPRRAAASPATRTRASSQSGRCWASRCRWRPRERWPAGSWRPPASRWRRRWAASPTGSRRRRRWPPWTLTGCRCPRPRPCAGRDGGQAARGAPAGVGPWTVAYVALRSGDDDAFMPTDLGVRHGLAALGGSWRRRRLPRRGGRSAGSPWHTCGPPRRRRRAAGVITYPAAVAVRRNSSPAPPAPATTSAYSAATRPIWASTV